MGGWISDDCVWWDESAVDWPEGYEHGRAEPAGAPQLDASTNLREFPIGFHGAAPGPSHPERPRVRVKAGRGVIP